MRQPVYIMFAFFLRKNVSEDYFFFSCVFCWLKKTRLGNSISSSYSRHCRHHRGGCLPRMSITRCTPDFTTIRVYKGPDHQCWLALPTSLDLRCTTLRIPCNSASSVCPPCLPHSVMKKHNKNNLGMCLSSIYKIFFSGGSRLEIRWYLQRFKRPLGPGGSSHMTLWKQMTRAKHRLISFVHRAPETCVLADLMLGTVLLLSGPFLT